MTGFWLHP